MYNISHIYINIVIIKDYLKYIRSIKIDYKC